MSNESNALLSAQPIACKVPELQKLWLYVKTRLESLFAFQAVADADKENSQSENASSRKREAASARLEEEEEEQTKKTCV